MNIEKIEALKALKHYGVHTARSRMVDSPEAAIAFAERRNAPDPRFMPILLRCGDETSDALETEDAIRRAFEYFARSSSTQQMLAQEVIGSGTDITIAGRTDPDDGTVIELRGAKHRAQRMMPLGDAGAEFLATNFQAHHHHGADDKARRMIENLLLRVSAFFEDSGVSEFSLRVRLHENSYTVLDAVMNAPKALHLKERLDPHAHDRKAADYHPAGRE
jgi:hypothetical protein